MISFRYHLVSLICVFLGIALGVVIGTAALNGAVVGDLRRQNTDLKATAAARADQNQALQAKGNAANELAQAFGARISNKALAGKKVVLVGLPGATKAMKEAIGNQITAAGGSVNGSVQLSKDFDDPRRGNDIQSLATSGAHPITLQLPQTDNPGTLAGSLLGFVLLGHGSATDLTTVLAGFNTLNMLQVDSGATTGSNAAVLVGAGGLPKADEGGAMLLSFITQFGTQGGPTVVAGDAASADNNGVVGLVRSDGSAQKAVSTVDDADTSLGQLTVALTVADTLAGRKGNYGAANGADALLPGLSS
ncbi:MAG TPA: copper transporter [Jatrophihabitans sp.]|nr:copper transporter [Jatrophihabitans sp.]